MQSAGFGQTARTVSFYLIIHRMDNLRWISLRNNFLVDVSKLKNYTNLEEICIERNELSNIDCLNALPKLIKLDASSNKISTLDASFPSLMFLSLEKNQFKSLR